MSRLFLFLVAVFFTSCCATPKVSIWTGWQVNNVTDFDGLRPEQKMRVVELGREQLEVYKIPCGEPVPDPTPYLTEEEAETNRFSREDIERVVTDLLQSWNRDLGINELEYELHECIKGTWVCKLPITLTHAGAPLVRTVTVDGIDIELEYDVTFVWRM